MNNSTNDADEIATPAPEQAIDNGISSSAARQSSTTTNNKGGHQQQHRRDSQQQRLTKEKQRKEKKGRKCTKSIKMRMLVRRRKESAIKQAG